jgi:hypothetical protein
MGRTACTEPHCLYKGALYLIVIDAGPGVGLRPLACWDSAFESLRVHGLPLVGVVCCQSSLRRTDHSSRGVLPNIVCLNVIMNPL